MKFYLPTYEECKEIVLKNESFYSSIQEIGGCVIETFNYRLAMAQDFVRPIAGKDIQAHELRGICFVKSESETKRFIMLHKFFNLNQVEGYQYGDVIKHRITNVKDKLDGSMIRFIRLPNGDVLAKTKMGFSNPQSLMAQDIYEKDKDLQNFIKATLDNALAAIFEFVSIYNRIVLVYSKTELRLLQLRSEETGEYFDIYTHDLVNRYKVSTVKQEFPLSLDEYIEKSKTDKGIEGWVLTLDNGQMLKIKTDEYFMLHGILTEDLVRPNLILGMIVSKTIDDAISKLEITDVRRKTAEIVQKAVIHYMKESSQLVSDLISKFNGDKKAWAMENLKNEFFPIAASLVGRKELDLFGEIEQKLEQKLKKDTSHLGDAREWLKKRGVSMDNIEASGQEE
jgi:T4 RnlA family RNA ligase